MRQGEIMTILSQIPKEAFDSCLLSREFHERLLLGLDKIVLKAGIPASMVWSRLSHYCEPGADYDWVRDLRINEDAGLVYVGKHEIPATERMKAIVGACLRNYTDARILSVQEVLKRMKDDTLPSATVLLIPNFCLEAEDSAIAKWDTHQLMGLLIDRATAGQKTVLHIASWTTLEKQYGVTMRDHLEAYYACHDAKEWFTPAKINALV